MPRPDDVVSQNDSQRWPTERKLPVLVDGHLTVEQLDEALAVLETDGPETPMTRAEIVDWLRLHVRPAPHSPSPSTPPGTRGPRRPRRYATPAGRPGRMRTEARAAA